MVHLLKIKSCYYSDVVSGLKSFELRKDDRGYKVGDFIRFNVICDEKDANCFDFSRNCTNDSENRTISDDLYEIVYILRSVPDYGLSDGFCILGIRKSFD